MHISRPLLSRIKDGTFAIWRWCLPWLTVVLPVATPMIAFLGKNWIEPTAAGTIQKATILFVLLLALTGYVPFANERLTKGRRTRREGFFATYVDCVEQAIRATETAKDLSEEEIRSVQRAVLSIVCNIVAVFLLSEEGVVINASLMCAEPVEKWCTDGRLEGVHFASKTRQSDAYSHVLHLTAWAQAPASEAGIALPVAKNQDILLFGAPRAFINGSLEYVGNTVDEAQPDELVARQDDDVRNEIKAYLHGKASNFRSFICLQLRDGNGPVGVLNVQSNQVDILGPGKIYRNGMENCLKPFCAILGTLIAQECANKNETLT